MIYIEEKEKDNICGFLVIAYDEKGEPFYFKTDVAWFPQEDWDKFCEKNFGDKVHIVDFDIIPVFAQQELKLKDDDSEE